MDTVVAGHCSLEELRFENSFAQLGPAFSERRAPTPLPDAHLIAWSRDAGALIELRAGEERRDAFLGMASGNRLLAGMEPIAALYAGHQFGTFVAQLGDGRAILLGEVRTSKGESWEVQLKGAGPTAYSRFADGRAVLRSTIREYLCSEAMHALGIPSTRALAITGSSYPVYREVQETAAVLVRLAPTFVRFGSFEVFASRRQTAELTTLADYTIARFFPSVGAGADRYARFFAAVVTQTAQLMAAWQAVGFAHGVMNTDNFSIVGLTLDYGPFGFLDAYEPGFISNHTDVGGRYAFGAQPTIGLWNCHALARALTALVPVAELETLLGTYEGAYRDAYAIRMRAKLGIANELDGDTDLIVDVLGLLEAGRVDYTRFFRALCEIDVVSSPADDVVAQLFTDRDAWNAWQARYRARLQRDDRPPHERRASKRAANPKYILRNYLAHSAIKRAEVGDYTEIERLQHALRHPFEDAPQYDELAQPPPDWAHTISLSCSS